MICDCAALTPFRHNALEIRGEELTQGYPDGGGERFEYSAKGLIAYTNQTNATNFYGYAELRRKIAETKADFQIVCYTNNAAGDLVALLDGKGRLTRWNYDS